MRIIPILGYRRIFRLVHNNLNSSIFHDNRALFVTFLFFFVLKFELSVNETTFFGSFFSLFFSYFFFSFSESLLACLPYVINSFRLNVFFHVQEIFVDLNAAELPFEICQIAVST